MRTETVNQKFKEKYHPITYRESEMIDEAVLEDRRRKIKKIEGMFFPEENQLNCQKVIIQKLLEEFA